MYFGNIEWKVLEEIQVISASVLLFCWSFLLNFFFSGTVCSLVAHCVLFAFQRRPSLDLYCFSYNFPKQVMFIKVRARMKGCEVAPSQLLRVHILQKSYKGFLRFALTWKSTLFNFGHLNWQFVGTPRPPGAPAVRFTGVVPPALFPPLLLNAAQRQQWRKTD